MCGDPENISEADRQALVLAEMLDSSWKLGYDSEETSEFLQVIEYIQEDIAVLLGEASYAPDVVQA